MICWGASDENLISIKSDNAHGTRLAMEHLLSKGCRNIAYVGPTNSEQPQFQDRLTSYMAVTREKGLPTICPPLPENAVREEQGYEAVNAMIRDGIIFDGIFAANDFIALGAIRALDENGIIIGQSVRVIGFDGIATGSYSQPPLTSIEQDYQRAGEMLVEALIAVLRGEEPNTKPVPVRLLVRGSA
jgi:DNA-binding LacI/PurR family transcriptional regulator